MKGTAIETALSSLEAKRVSLEEDLKTTRSSLNTLLEFKPKQLQDAANFLTTIATETSKHEVCEAFVSRVGNIERRVAPVGTILAWGGQDLPEGWRECDGSTFERKDASGEDTALFSAIGTTWGRGDEETTFNLPDLRGYFLRGQTTSAQRDPDFARRYSDPNLKELGGKGVGSYQRQETAKHRHGLAMYEGWNAHTKAGTDNDHVVYLYRDGKRVPKETGLKEKGALITDPVGGNETRPKNAYVLFIIKAE